MGLAITSGQKDSKAWLANAKNSAPSIFILEHNLPSGRPHPGLGADEMAPKLDFWLVFPDFTENMASRINSVRQALRPSCLKEYVRDSRRNYMFHRGIPYG
jgi:hypothetical protein